MNIDDKLVNKLAGLAKLEFNGEEREEIKKDLNKILALVEKLNKLDTNNIEPLVFMCEEVNDTRDDVVKQNITQQDALLNAPQSDSDYFKVPKVLEKK